MPPCYDKEARKEEVGKCYAVTVQLPALPGVGASCARSAKSTFVLKARSTKEPEAAWLRRLRLAESPRDVTELLHDITDLQPQKLADLPRALPRIIAASPPCGDAGCTSPSYQPIKSSCKMCNGA
jgi:hypothetical protein